MKGKQRRLTSQACNKSVFPTHDGIVALISLAGVCRGRIRTVSQIR